MIIEGIQKLVEKRNLSAAESSQIMQEIMAGQATNAQIAAFLTALRMKGETVEELAALAEVMQKKSLHIHPKVRGRLVDTCGTGGDKIKTFNVSTAAAFVVAGAGIAVAKHGNRSVTSRSGSADVLEHLGVNLSMNPAEVTSTVEQIGIGFMFAPAFHPAMKYAVSPRKEMGIRTVFNVLGPLSNPASANAQLVGVYDPKMCLPVVNSLKHLGCEEAMVVHGFDGIDEISTFGITSISHLRLGEIKSFEVTPKDFGVKQARIADLQGGAPEENAKILFEVLSGRIVEGNPKREIVLVNSAAALVVGGKTTDFSIAMDIARESIDSGAAFEKLRKLVEGSKGDLSKLEKLEHYA